MAARRTPALSRRFRSSVVWIDRWCKLGAVVILLLTFSAKELRGQDRLVLLGATLIDGTGADPIPESRIVIVDGRFACVSGPRGCPPVAGERRLDVSGGWITPGLIDTHVHLNPVARPGRTAEAQSLRFALGITTVRDAGSLELEAILDAREHALAPEIPTPRILAAARPVELYAERFDATLGAELVARLVEAGADAIKIKDHLSGNLWEQEVRAAVELGVPVFGHTWRGPPPIGLTAEAIAAGLSGVSHLFAIAPASQRLGAEVGEPPPEPEFWPWRKRLWLTTDPEALSSLIAEMVRRGVWLEPMLVNEWYWGQELRPPQELSFLRRTPPSLRDLLTGHNALAEVSAPTFPGAFDRMASFIREFHETGGMLVTGSDGVRPGLDLHAEIALLRHSGLSPLESVEAATHNAAIALGRTDLGTVEVGKLADAVIYSADPLDPEGTTLSIWLIVKGGVIHESAPLLREFQERYRATVRGVWVDRAVRLALLCVILAAAAVAGVWMLRSVPKWVGRGER